MGQAIKPLAPHEPMPTSLPQPLHAASREVPRGTALLPRLADGPLRRALDASDDAIVMSNRHRRVVYVNQGFTRLFGYEPADVMGQYLSDVLLGEHSDRGFLEDIRDCIEREGRYHGEALVYRRDGQPRWISLVINTADEASGGPGGSITVLTDITLTKMHEVLQKRVLEGMVKELALPDLMALVCREVERIAPDVTASILSVDANGRLHPLAAPGLPPEISAALEGLPIGPAVGSCGTAAYRAEPVMVQDIQTDPLWQDYRALFAPTGLRGCWSSPIVDHQGRVVGTFAFYFREPRLPDELHHRLIDACLHLCALAIERDAARQRIHQLAFYDGLTGLPNRALFKASAERTLALLARAQQAGALLFLNLDRFKQINDTQGHAAGDLVLCTVAQRLSVGLRPHDLMGRLSGDEFVMLLSGVDSVQAVQIAQSQLEAVAKPVQVHGQQYRPSASIGIALFPDDGADVDALLRHAGQAMSQAKADTQHRLQLFSAEMNQRALDRVAMERSLRDALARRALSLQYQPQVLSTAPDVLHSVEALARWHHPERGAVPPSEFIPLAEEVGLIHELTLWLLDTACAQLAAWRRAGCAVPSVSVNLSGHCFHRPEFADQVSAALAQNGLQPSDLVLEITESVMMDARPVTLANIELLHRRGFRLSLDDFGTGYSSLSYLHRLPIAELKLDKAFVQDLATSDAARALTVSVLSIAHSLGMVVVAEGVETVQQHEWLRTHGCPVMQGYLFARPLDAGSLADWLHRPHPG